MSAGNLSLYRKNAGKAANARVMRRLMTAASISALVLAGPQIMITPGFAQALPSGCSDAVTTGTPNNNDSFFSAGETITCVSTSVIPQISTAVDDVTIIIGDTSTPTAVVAGPMQSGVFLNRAGTVDIRNPGSSVTGDYYGVEVISQPADTQDITIMSEGVITATDGRGISVDHYGDGSIVIDVADVSGTSRGIRTNANAGTSGDISITSTGVVSSTNGAGVEARNDGSGSTLVNVANVAAGSSSGHIGVWADHYGHDLTIASSGTITAGGFGVLAENQGTGSTTINVNNIDADGTGISARMNTPGTTGNLTIIAAGTIDGEYGITTLNLGDGDVNVSVNAINAIDRAMVFYNATGTTGNLTVTSTGAVTSQTASAVYVTQNGAGDTAINIADVTAGADTDDDAIFVDHRGGDLTVTSTGALTAGGDGVRINNTGTGATTIGVYEIDAGGDAINAIIANTAGDLAISATGAVEGGVDGIDIQADALAAVDITVVDVTGTTGDGINIDADDTGAFTPGPANIAITSTGTITGGRHGVYLDVYREDYPGTTLNLNNVNAGTGDGVHFRGLYLAEGLSISVTGDIVAGDDGIDIIDGNGYDHTLNVSVNNVYGGDKGIDLEVRHRGNIIVTSTGLVEGGGRGIEMVDTTAGGPASSVTVDVLDVTGGDVGVYASSVKNDFTFTSTGTVTGTAGDGVFLNRSSSSVETTTLNLADVVAGADGIEVTHNAGFGSGALSIVSTGTITAGGAGALINNTGIGATTVSLNNVDVAQDAIVVNTAASTAGDVSVTATGAMNAGENGVFIDNRGSGNTSVSVAGVTAGSGVFDHGVQAFTSGDDLTVVATGTISAGGAGVLTEHRGTGDMTISVNSIDAGATGVGAAFGIPGTSGDLTVTSTGQIDAGSGGVSAINLGTGGVDISVNDVDAVQYAAFIYAATGGSGDVSLTATGAVVSQDYDTIMVYQYGAGDTTINVADVTAADPESNAIVIDHRGGDLSLTSTGAISSAGYGVKAYNTGTGDTTISVGNVAADYGAGILAQNQNAGALSITATGGIAAYAVDGDYAGVGIWADAQADGDVTVNAADVYGQTYGVHVQSAGGAVNVTAEDVSGYYNVGVRVAQSTGAGDVSVTTTGAVTSAEGTGVYVSNGGTGAIGVHVNSIESAYGGINAYSSASAAGNDVTVTASGAIEAGGYGIFASNSGYGGVNISASNIDADIRGILAVVFAGSTGDINVTTSGAVVAQDRNAIGVFQSGSGDTIIDINDVTAVAEYAALSVLHGGGDFSVNAAGTLTSGGYGVTAFSFGTGATTINVENINAEYGGLDLTQSAGAGDVSITATGAVTSDKGNGVYAFNFGNGATAISVNSITAGDGIGIVAGTNFDGGGLTITATGDVRAYGDDMSGVVTSSINGFISLPTGVGILARSSENGVSVSAADVYGEVDGINVGNTRSGALTVSAVNVTGGTRDGVNVINSASDDTVLNVTGVVTGARYGIRARSFGGEGSIAITANDVSSISDDGISARKGGYGYDEGDIAMTTTGDVSGGVDGIDARVIGLGSLTIASYNVSGAEDGVNAYAYSGALSITTSGTVTATNGDGVRADRYGLFRYDKDYSYQDRFGVDEPFVADVSVSVATVTGAERGVYATNGNGGVSITVAGTVIGEGGEGILSDASAGTEITIHDGGSVTGATSAIRLNETAGDVVTLNSGGSIAGDALLLGGDDVFNDAGGQFTTVFGGDGTDTVNFEAGGARTISGSGGAEDALQEFEAFNFNAGGFTLAGAHTGLSETNFNAGVNTLTGTLTSTETTVAEGATLNKADGSVINGLLTVNGTLSIGNSPGVSTIDGDVVFGPASVLPIETLGDAHDTLIVTGSVTLDGEIQIIHLGDLDIGTTRRTIIDGDRDIIGSHATVSSEEGLLISNSVDFDPSGFDLILTTTVNSALSVDGLTGDELSLGEHLVGLLGQPSLDPELAGVINAVGAVPEVDNLSAVLAELRPEGFDGGLRFLANAQGRFMSNMIDVPAHAARRASPNGAHIWGAIDLSHLSKNDEPRHVGFEGDAYELSAGVSGIGRGPLRFGLAGGYARFEGDTKAGVTDAIDVSLYRLAASARIDMGGAGANGHIDTVVSFAKGENELEMRLIDPVSDAQITQSGQADISSIGFATRFTMTGADGRQWLVRPHAEIGLDVVRQDAVDVRGVEAGATALAVERLDSTRAHIALGAAFDRDVGKSLSLNASVEGVRYFSDTENVIEARFAAAPYDVPAFRTIGANVEWQARMRAGASYAHKSGFVLSADAFGEAGDLTAYGARVELLRRF